MEGRHFIGPFGIASQIADLRWVVSQIVKLPLIASVVVDQFFILRAKTIMAGRIEVGVVIAIVKGLPPIWDVFAALKGSEAASLHVFRDGVACDIQ